MAFQGSLAELHLPDIIQLVSVSGKSGVFHLADGDNAGRIFLADGRIVHAELDELAGEEAVYALAIWRQGEFRFEASTAAAPRQTIQKSNTSLLMEAARRMDEWRVLSKKIPSVDHVPEFVILDNREGQINLNTMEWLLLSKIDGQRSLKSIAAAAQLSVFDAAKLLYGLVTTGLIRLRDPTTGTFAPDRASSAAGTSSGGGGDASSVLTLLGRLRDKCVTLVGPAGESVVEHHIQRARAQIEGGAGVEAVEAALGEIARAAGVLKGKAVAEAVLQLGRKPR